MLAGVAHQLISHYSTLSLLCRMEQLLFYIAVIHCNPLLPPYNWVVLMWIYPTSTFLSYMGQPLRVMYYFIVSIWYMYISNCVTCAGLMSPLFQWYLIGNFRLVFYIWYLPYHAWLATTLIYSPGEEAINSVMSSSFMCTLTFFNWLIVTTKLLCSPKVHCIHLYHLKNMCNKHLILTWITMITL